VTRRPEAQSNAASSTVDRTRPLHVRNIFRRICRGRSVVPCKLPKWASPARYPRAVSGLHPRRPMQQWRHYPQHGPIVVELEDGVFLMKGVLSKVPRLQPLIILT
jgi:hypothetical protein